MHLGVFCIFFWKDVKDMDQQMGYHILEWSWPKAAMNIPTVFGPGVLLEPRCFNFI